MSEEYFVDREPIEGDTVSYGPFTNVQEARDCFENTYPAFAGSSITLIKVESRIPGVSPSALRRKALEEEWDHTHDPEGDSWATALAKSTTVLARDVWDVSQDQAGMIYRHAGKKYETKFLAEIAGDPARASKVCGNC